MSILLDYLRMVYHNRFKAMESDGIRAILTVMLAATRGFNFTISPSNSKVSEWSRGSNEDHKYSKLLNNLEKKRWFFVKRKKEGLTSMGGSRTARRAKVLGYLIMGFRPNNLTRPSRPVRRQYINP